MKKERNAANVTDCIYLSADPSSVKPIKPYKLKRLRFANDKSFWPIWENAEFGDKTYLQLIYKLTTAMSLSLFTDDEMSRMLIAWHNRHDLRINTNTFAFVIKSANAFTLPVRKRRKREQNRRCYIKRKLNKILAASTEVFHV